MNFIKDDDYGLSFLREEAETPDEQSEIDALLPQDPDTEEGADNLADQVEQQLQQEAFSNIKYFDGGQEAARAFFESAEIATLIETSVSAQTVGGLSKKRTLVILNKNDDLERRAKLACILIARDKKDPLFEQWSKYRVLERARRKAMYKKYYKQGLKVARLSQKKHIREKKSGAMPKFNKPLTTNDIAHGRGNVKTF